MKGFTLGLSVSCLLLLAVAAVAVGHTGTGTTGVSEYNWGEKEGDSIYKVEREGDVRFTADDADVQALTANGRLRIQETRGNRTTVFEVRRQGDAPALQRSFSVDGQAKSGEEARAWLARTLPAVIRRTGLGAADRVERLHERGGVDAVLAEIRSLPSDWVKGLYSAELVNRRHLAPADLQRVLTAVTEVISSGYERAELLRHTAGTFLASPGLAAPFFAHVIRVPSPYRGDLLTQIAQEPALDNPVVRAAYQEALRRASEPESSGKKDAAKGLR